MKRILLVVLSVCLLAVSGCATAPSKTGDTVGEQKTNVTGRYVHFMSPLIYIELKDDGTYCHKFGKRNVCDTYVIDGNRVILNAPKKFELEIEGNSLVDKKDGVRYTKQ